MLRSTHSKPNSLSLTEIPPNLTQICSDSLRFLQSHTDLLILLQFHADSLRFTQLHTVSDSLDLVQTCFDPFRRTRIQSDSHSFTPDSFCFPQTHRDSQRFTQICFDKLQLTDPGGKREMLPLPRPKGKGDSNPHFITDST